MKQTLLGNWNFMRVIRLVLGIFIIVQAAMIKDWTMGLLGVFFTALPVLNIGCCGTGACTTPPKKNVETNTKDISYEEVV